jgi:hypothetical protein
MPETQIILGPNDEEIKFPIDMPVSEITKIMQKEFGIKQNRDNTQNITQEVPPIPDVIVPERPRLKDPIKQLGESFYNRPTFQAFGGTAGFIAGTPLPGFGNLVASAVGATGGGQLYDLIETLRGNQEPRNLPESAKSTVKDLVTEGVYTAGFGALPVVGQGIKRRVYGIKDNISAQKLYEAGKRLNVPLNLAGITEKGIPLAYQKVVGVFPFLGTPLRKGYEKQKTALNTVADDILNSFGPNVSLAKLGVKVYKAARKTNLKFRKISSGLYNQFTKDVAALPEDLRNVIGLKNAKETVTQLEKELPKFKVMSEKGIVDSTKLSPRENPIYDYLQKIKSIQGNIDPIQYKSLQQDINFLIKEANPEDVRRLKIVKEGLEKDFLDLSFIKNVITAKNNPELQILYDNVTKSHGIANKFYSEGMKKFETSTAKRFQRADKNIFSSQLFKSGTINQDELIKAVIKLDSPQAIKDLKSLMPDKVYKKVMRAFVDKAFDAGLIKDVEKTRLNYDVNKIKDVIGFQGKNKERLDVLKEVFKSSDVSFSKFNDFLTLASKYQGSALSDPSTFVARRVILGGAKSIPGVKVFTSAAVGSFVPLPVTAALIYLGRKGSKILSNPKKLDDLMVLLNPKSNKLRTYQMAMRLYESLASSKDSTKEEKIGFINMRNELANNIQKVRRNSGN